MIREKRISRNITILYMLFLNNKYISFSGRTLFPATGYLFLAWVTLAEFLGTNIEVLKVIFENCKFIRACSFPKTKDTDSQINLSVTIQKVSGCFEITGKNEMC